MPPISLQFENPPRADDATLPTREQIAATLREYRGKWAIVGRHDRVARAETHADRINSDKEYGAGFESVVRRVGNEHRVYARKK